MKRLLPVLALSALLPAAGMGQTASLVKDLTPGTFADASSSPRQFLAVGNKVFFTAQNQSFNDQELWVTDGSPEGTQLLGDLCPGSCSSGPSFLGSARGLLFFTAVTGRNSSGAELWRSDGTRKGTFALAGRVQGSSAFAAGTLVFTNCSQEDGCNLWASDGTAEGTVFLKDFTPDYDDFGNAEQLTAMGSKVYFLEDSLSSSGQALWVTDGTAGGTRVVREIGDNYYSLGLLTAAGDRLFFTARQSNESELWTSDGTAAGTRQVTNFEAPDPFAPTRWLKPIGNEVFFLADDVTHGVEIWRSDGTSQGTRRATDIGFHQPFDSSFGPDTIVKLGDRLVFLATDGIHNYQVWSALGAPESAAPLAEGCPDGCPDAYSTTLLQVGSRVVFTGYDENRGSEPWSTDGTAAGTRLLRNICPDQCDSVSLGPVALLGSAFFIAREENSYDGRSALWRSDGTPEGTKRFAGPFASVAPEVPAALGRRLVFAARTAAYGTEPWIGDGTPGGTRLLGDLVHGALGSYPQELTALGSQVFLSAGVEDCRNVWRSSGAAGDLAQVTAAAGFYCQYGSGPTGLVASGGLLYFWFYTSDTDYQVWATDGTPDGLRQVTRLEPGPYSDPPRLVPLAGKVYTRIERPYPDESYTDVWRIDGSGAARVFTAPELNFLYQLNAVGDRLYFSSYQPDGGSRLWGSDGGTASTVLLTMQGSPSVPRARLGVWDYFVVEDAAYDGQSSLWKTDGTPSGTLRVKSGFGKNIQDHPSSFAVHQGALYFFAGLTSPYGGGDWGLWRTDGTEAGTRLLKVFVRPYEEPSPGPVSHDGHLYFAARDAAHGRELWRSDGTVEGTVLVRDILPGEEGSGVSELTVAGGRLFFAAADPIHGHELWQTDGTEAGTRLVHDIAPMAASSLPAELTVAGERLFFVSDDGVSGRELWSLSLNGSAQGCQPSATTLCLNQGRFRVDVTWHDFQGNTGLGQAVALTADTGYFWFFDPGNVELVVKVLDGLGVNGHHWVFYGALSSVEYNLTVTDTVTGLTRHYFNPLNQLASVGDTRGFGPLGAFSQKKGTPSIHATTAPAAACQATATRLCLQGGRFAAEVSWKDFAGKTGQGRAVSLTGDTGYFWFFNADNVEVVVKVLDGRPVNDRFWAFYGALSNVEYTLKITDTQTGAMKSYSNPSGSFASVADTSAF